MVGDGLWWSVLIARFFQKPQQQKKHEKKHEKKHQISCKALEKFEKEHATKRVLQEKFDTYVAENDAKGKGQGRACGLGWGY